jgi:hypothetical protein
MMTDEKAKQLAEASFRLEEDRVKLRRQYYKKIEKELGSTLAARFTQIDRQIQLLLDIQIAAQIPLIKPAGD